MERKEWRTVPYHARRYQSADDLGLHAGNDYFNDDIILKTHVRDVAVTPVRTTDNTKEVLEFDVDRWPTTIYYSAYFNQVRHDSGIVYERHKKGIPILQICDVKLQYGSEDHAEFSWKLDEVTKEECKLEIDQLDKNEQGKKTVKFGFATNDTDKLLSQVVGGYEVKYILRTDAIRLKLDLEVVLTPPHTVSNFSIVHNEVKLEIQHDSKTYTINLLCDQPPEKKPKLGHPNNTFKRSIIANVPRNLHPCMELAVKLKDSSGTLDVDQRHQIFSYNIPVDQEDYFLLENGYIKFNVFWGCCFDKGKGLCTCKPAEFVGFRSPGEVSCIKNNEQ